MTNATTNDWNTESGSERLMLRIFDKNRRLSLKWYEIGISRYYG